MMGFLRRGPPLVHHRLADLEGVLDLGIGEALGRVLEDDLGARHEPSPALTSRVPSTAMALISAFDRPKVTLRCTGDVEL